MRRAVVTALALVGLSGGPAPAATTPAPPALANVAAVLADGYDVKAAFSDNQGGAYIMLQKGTSAYMCHSNPNPRCEKLN